MANIIPRPISVKQTDEKVFFSKKTEISGEFAEVVKPFENLIADSDEAQKNKLTFIADKQIAKDGYKIVCENGDINVFCSESGGALYAFMTLVQLAAGGDSFNAVTVNDAPKYSWRGFMLDCSRHFWTTDKIKQVLDFMASIKMNVFHWHLSDDQGWRIEIKKYPLLTEKGSIRKGTQYSIKQFRDMEKRYIDGEYGRGLFYTQDEAREIVKYAAERNITVVPEIDIPGHATAAIACYPELSCTGEEVEVSPLFGIFKNNLCCAKPAVYEFVKSVIDELCDIFPSPYIHIGGDEVESEPWDNCPDCQALMKEHNLKSHVELHGYFNNIIIAYLKEKGRHTVGYNEIISDNLDKSAIAHVWTTRALEQALDWAEKGGKTIQMLSPYVYADMSFARIPLSKTYNYNPYFEGFTNTDSILGFEIPLWTEYVPNEKKFDFQIFVRLLAMSEVSWAPIENKNYEDFEQRVENMRTFFKNKGINLAPRRIYCGNTFMGADSMTPEQRAYLGYQHFANDPYFEVELLDLYK